MDKTILFLFAMTVANTLMFAAVSAEITRQYIEAQDAGEEGEGEGEGEGEEEGDDVARHYNIPIHAGSPGLHQRLCEY